jgi:toxin-antitoxin system PIN domain toxin
VNDEDPVGLPWIVLLEFLRLATSPRVFPAPLTTETAAANLDTWLAQDNIRVVREKDDHWAALKSLLHDSGTAGNLTTDAHRAALAITHDARAITTSPTSRDCVGRIRSREMGKPRIVFVDHAQTAFQRHGECTIVRIEHFGVRSADFKAFNRSRESFFQSRRIDTAHTLMAGQNAHGAFVRLYLMGSDRVLERSRGAYRRLSMRWIIDRGVDSARLLAPFQPRKQPLVGQLLFTDREWTFRRIEQQQGKHALALCPQPARHDDGNKRAGT